MPETYESHVTPAPEDKKRDSSQVSFALGVVAQLNLPFDELFPNTLGKPVVDWIR